jgi:hypothetical protein
MFGLHALELDRDFFAGDDVGSYRCWISHVRPTDDGMPYPSKYHQSFRCRSSARCGTCCPREDPKNTDRD